MKKPRPKPPYRPRAKASNIFAQWVDGTGLTYARVGKMIGASTGFVANIRSGRYVPGRELATRIAKASDGAVPVSSWSGK